MSGSRFVSDTYVPRLGAGTGLALWGFRVCALRGVRCCAIVQGFRRAFGDEAPGVLSDMLAFARVVGFDGRRKVTLGKPDCARMTADEVSIAAMFAAAQAHDAAARDAHLLWILAKPPTDEVCELVTRIADAFAAQGLRIVPPPAVVATQAAAKPSLSVAAGGRA